MFFKATTYQLRLMIAQNERIHHSIRLNSNEAIKLNAK